MPTKTTGKGLQRVTSRVYITDPDKPRPREHTAKGAGPCCAALEKRKRKLGMYVTIYSYESWFCLLTILMDSQVSKSLKQQFLILLLCRPALHLSHSLTHSLSLSHTDTLSLSLALSLALSLSRSLSLSHSDRQISSNKLSNYRLFFTQQWEAL